MRIMEFLFHIDLISFIRAAGYVGIFGIVFAESGLLFGFIFPGDSLLFTAGFLASQGYFDVFLLLAITFAGAILGDNAGYAFGKRVGPYIFTKKDSFFFRKEYALRAEGFFKKHGAKALVIARFMPIVRTFTPIVAGVGNMKYSVFLTYNFFGGALWAIGVTLLGYFLGRSLPNADRYLPPIIAVIIATSFVPVIVEIVRDPDARLRIAAYFRFPRKKFFPKD